MCNVYGESVWALRSIRVEWNFKFYSEYLPTYLPIIFRIRLTLSYGQKSKLVIANEIDTLQHDDERFAAVTSSFQTPNCIIWYNILYKQNNGITNIIFIAIFVFGLERGWNRWYINIIILYWTARYYYYDFAIIFTK